MNTVNVLLVSFPPAYTIAIVFGSPILFVQIEGRTRRGGELSLVLILSRLKDVLQSSP